MLKWDQLAREIHIPTLLSFTHAVYIKQEIEIKNGSRNFVTDYKKKTVIRLTKNKKPNKLLKLDNVFNQ